MRAATRSSKGLQLAGLLGPGGDSTMHVDLLKVPHHGSSNNLERDFFERITADHYVFSGNGEHGNPEREALEMLFDARGSAEFTVHLTYPVEEIDEGRREDWTKAQKQKEKREKRRPIRHRTGRRRRKAWRRCSRTSASPEEKIRIVDPDRPHVIDLLDAVEF